MRKGDIELLAPAGSYEALVAAVQSGANAIYVGGLQFGARAFANNFDNETMKKAVEYCHLHDVLLYVTVNTLYSDEQFNELIEYITFLYCIGIDAFIVQDMGLFHLIKKYFPDIEIHMSTQASIKNLEGVKYFEKQNVDRVVLAREMNIQEISTIANQCDIDLEVFVHGAICMSYSGQCLMSSMLSKRSGNKGKCSQPCRLSYSLLEDGNLLTENQYLLSPQDLCSIENIGKLIEAGIKSFKVEGRMKRPEYVYTVIRAYRRAIDHYLNNIHLSLNDDILNMKKMFNRGFTAGFLFHDSLSLSKEIPGNQGIFLGNIQFYNHKNKMLYIQLEESLSQGDRIFFPKNDLTRTITKLYKDKKLVNSANKGDTIGIELNTKIDLKQKIYKVIDIHLINQIQNNLKNENIHLPLEMRLFGEIGKPLKLELKYKQIKTIVYSNEKVEKAIHKSIGIDRLKAQLTKLGNTVYEISRIDISFPEDGIISIKEINNLRRKGIEQLNLKRLERHRQIIPQITYPVLKNKRKEKKIVLKVSSVKQLDNVNTDGVDHIFIPYYEYKTYNMKFIPYVPFLYNEKQLISFIHSNIFHQIQTVMVSDFGAYHLIKDHKKIILNSNFNLTNSFSLKELNEDTVLSLELSKEKINHLKSSNQLYLTAYSKIINMNLKHCIISDYYFGHKNKKCYLCKKHHYQLKNKKEEQFDIITDSCCNNYILNNKALFIQNINQFNVDYILLDFINEDAPLINKIIKDFQMNILGNGENTISQKTNIFRGYYE